MKLIVEMEMPTRCGACKCRHVEFDIDRVAVFCAIMDNEYVEDPDSRPTWCTIKGELVRCGECRHYGTEIGWNCKTYNVCKKTTGLPGAKVPGIG